MTSKQEQGHKYRVGTMFLLSRVGYATTRQVAMGVFGGCDVSCRKMAGRTIRWLYERGYVVAKREGDTVAGEMMIALNRAGVDAFANTVWLPDGRPSAKDWLRHAHKHRTACNSVFVAINPGGLGNDGVWSELEVRAGVAPPELSGFAYTFEGKTIRKIPDLVTGGNFKRSWIEVENGWRGARDFEKLVAFLRQIFDSPTPPIEWVEFVVASPAAKTIGRRLEAAMSHSLSSGYPRQIKELDARILANHIRVRQLDPDQLRLTTLTGVPK